MATASSEIPSTKRRALIVDDSQIARYILSGQLKRLGFEVEVAESAESAIQQLKGPLPDVVFMDYLLPGIDGIEAVTRLRGQRHTSSLPIVMYTSQDSESFATRARKLGANYVYVKTDDDSKLIRILQRLSLHPVRESMSQSEKSPDVQSIPRLKTASSPGERPTPAIDPQAVARLLEPSFETYHGRLRQELLAEFAILERYEERMRKDLFSRVNRVLGQANKRVDDAFLADRIERGRARRRQTLATLSAAAAILLGITVNAVFSWSTAERAAELERTSASVIGLMDGSRQDLAALRKDVMQNTADPEVAPASLTVTHGASESYAAAYPTEPPGGAAALVSELHSMGILGPVRVETSAGSFCVRPTSNGFELAGSNVDLSDCEVLPVQLSAARRIQ